MANINEILGKQINSVKQLKDEIKNLQNSLLGVDKDSAEFAKTSAQLAAAQDELTKITRAGKEENLAAKDSIVGMQQEYKKLYDQYKLLSDEQRNSDFGKNMAASLETLSNKLNETKQGVGNFKDNIGRYTDSVTAAFSKMGLSVGALQGPLKTATVGFKGLNTVMKANPIGIIITALTALVALFMKVKDAIGKNEELQMRYNEAMAKLQPIADAVSNGLDKLASVLVGMIEKLTSAVQKVREFGAGLTDFLGITKDAKSNLQEQAKIYDDIAKSQSNLTKMKREYAQLNSKDKSRVEALREEASETTNLQEKNRLLNEAKTIQAEIDQRNIEIAQEELRILEEQSTLTANDAAMNDRLAAATVKVSEAEAAAASNARRFNKELKSTTSTTSTATKSLTNYREEAKKIYEQTVEDSKTEIQKLTEKYEKEKRLLEKYHYDTKLLTQKYNADMVKIIKSNADKELEKAKAQREKEKKNREEYLTSLNQMMVNYYKNQSNGKVFYKDASDILDSLIKDVETQINGKKDAFGRMWSTIFQFIPLDKIGDYEAVNNALNLLDIDDKDKEEILKEWNTITEEIWDTLTSNIIKKTNTLNDVFGLNIEYIRDFGGAIDTLVKSDLDDNLDSFSNGLENLMYTFFDTGAKELGPLSEEFNNLYTETILENEYKVLDATARTYREAIDGLDMSLEEKTELYRTYYAVIAEMESRWQALMDLDTQRTQEMIENLTDTIANLSSTLGTIKSSYDTLIDSELKAGKIDEQQARAKKKRLLDLEKAQTAFSIASIAADAATGLFTIWKGYATEVGTVNPQTAAAAGPGAAPALAALNTKSLVSAIAKSASLAATATAQIMAARNGYVADVNNFAGDSSSSSSASVGTTPYIIDSTPYSYTRTVQTQEDVDELNSRPIWVSVSDLESGLNQRVQVVGESSF